MRQPKKLALAAAIGASTVFISACQDDTGTRPLPPAESATAASTAASPSPTPPAWEAKYSERQLRTYEAALRRYQEYETKSEPVWRAGKATDQTEHFFKEYFFAWPNQQRLLTTYEQNKVRMFGLGRTLSSRPTRIVASGDSGGQSVTIRQCVNFNTTNTTQYGKGTKKLTTKPQIRIVTLSRFNRPGAPWKISEIRNSQGNRPCSAA